MDEFSKNAIINKDIDFLKKLLKKAEENYTIDIFDGRGTPFASSERIDMKDGKFNQPEFNIIPSRGYGYDIRTGADKAKTVYVAIPVTEQDKKIGFVRISTPLLYIEKTINRLRVYVILIFIFSVPISFMISMFLAKSISHPLIEMTSVARKISSGNLNCRIDIKKRRDEIGILVNTFNEMIERLKAVHNERKVLFDNISHELMTPITTIRGFVETIYDGKVKDKKVIEECLELIKKESGYLEGLIEELQFISQIDALSVKYDFKPLNVTEVILDAEESFIVRAKEKNIDISNDFIKDCPNIKADYKTLKRVFVNILDNAIKYSLEDRKILVSVRRMDRFLKVSVEDHGIGIDSHDKSRIFERFYRNEEASGIYKGLGLGLSIVKEILNAHHADIEVNSRPNEGSQFIITFQVA